MTVREAVVARIAHLDDVDTLFVVGMIFTMIAVCVVSGCVTLYKVVFLLKGCAH